MSQNFPTLPPQVPSRGTPLSKSFFKKLFLAQGWSFDGDFPDLPKAVAIVSPHTSNYDAFYGFLAMLGIGIKVTVFGKDSLFKTPLKGLFEWMGVIPVRRDSAQGLTQQIIDVIRTHDKIWIALAPEGTRKAAPNMKSGFYHIAHGANIPIVMFSLDYDHKSIRCLGVMYPTGNFEKDLEYILNCYKDNFSPKIAKRLAIPLQKIWQKDIDK